jgi:hypothetical protein
MRLKYLLLISVLLIFSGCGSRQANQTLSDPNIPQCSVEEDSYNISPTPGITKVPTPTLLPTAIPTPAAMADYDTWQDYITKVIATFTCDKTTFRINGKEFDMQDIDPSINAITDYHWFGNSMLQEPYLFLDCHINPNIGYGAVFDVEKMDFVFGGYGTNFTYKVEDSKSLVYVFDNYIYNYWGDILYQNTDTKNYIYELKYPLNLCDNEINITLSTINSEKLTEVTCLNYHTPTEMFPELAEIQSKDTDSLAEFTADLNHDGKKEQLNIYKTEYGDDLAFLELTDTSGKSIRLEYAHTSHVGWNSVYLCTIKNKDYLFIFNPYQCTGTADFTYEVYYLEETNTLHLIDSGYYTFSYETKRVGENAFDEEAFRSFADKANSYLSHSLLLMSTEDGTLRYSTQKKHVSIANRYKTDQWLCEIKSNLY